MFHGATLINREITLTHRTTEVMLRVKIQIPPKNNEAECQLHAVLIKEYTLAKVRAVMEVIIRWSKIAHWGLPGAF